MRVTFENVGLSLTKLPHMVLFGVFFLLTALALAALIKFQQPKIMMATGALFGIVEGIGLGMRTDVVLNFAPFFLTTSVPYSKQPRMPSAPSPTCTACSLPPPKSGM